MKRLGLVTAAAADVAAVVALRPHPAEVAGSLRHPRAALAQHGADRALLPLLGAAAWLVAAWLAVALLAVLAARLPGAAGRAGAAAARALVPRALRALLTGSAGLGVLLAPAAAIASAPSPTPSPAAPPGSASPAWPVSTSAPAASSGPSGPSVPLWPTADPKPTPTPAPAPASPPPTRPAAVSVRPGDTLWTIAGAQLGRQATPVRIAAAWPRWFAANRAVIGADPKLIRPGQVLTPPDGARHHPHDPEARP